MKNKLKLLITLCFLVPLFAFARDLLRPADWVVVHATRVPLDISEIHLIARNGDTIFPLNGYHQKITFFSSDPRSFGGVLGGANGDASHLMGDVQWKKAEAYGFLVDMEQGGWKILWLPPGEPSGPSFLRYLIGGGGRISLEVPKPDQAIDAPKSLTSQFKSQVRLR